MGTLLIGVTLLVITFLFFIGAFSAAYFRKLPHLTPLDQLTWIAQDRVGWTAQAVIFPVALFATTVVFGILAFQLPENGPRWLGISATVLFGIGSLLWVPLSISRLHYWPKAVELLRTYDPSDPADVNFGGKTFWSHTYSVLTGVAGMALALALGGVLPILGWVVMSLAILSVVAALLWHDWPPFMTYVILLVLSIGLVMK